MDTIKDVLCFLNDHDFADRLGNDYLENLLNVKKMIVREFEDNNTSKMIYALNIIDEIKLSKVTNDLDNRFERTDSLGLFFNLISLKHLADTNVHEN